MQVLREVCNNYMSSFTCSLVFLLEFSTKYYNVFNAGGCPPLKKNWAVQLIWAMTEIWAAGVFGKILSSPDKKYS